MKIGGLQKFSLIDYPGEICAIVFTQGCNFRCPYCHNPELADPDLYEECIPEEEIFAFLKKRKGKLDAVSITGGEPTLQPDLIDFIKKIKTMGYLIKIDTNGSHPETLKTLIEDKLIDYVAMDVKAPLEKYQKITMSKTNPDLIKQSIKLIKKSRVPYEFRTTIVKSQLNEKDLLSISELVKNTRLYILQKFIPTKTVNPKFMDEKTYSDEEFDQFKKKIEKYVRSVIVR
ncbi:MAG: anaerobic ribonucleoside-triphosphate reductase activating protein [Syntrophobacterales bacterium]|nr:anaerobic ribonucleoside-triphosphate reductase activating protein [Syntrophobacterales bacterium]